MARSAEGGVDGSDRETGALRRRARDRSPSSSPISTISAASLYDNHYAAGLGLGDVDAVPVDEADRLAFRRDAQRRGHLMAGPHQPSRNRPRPVRPRQRHRADDPGGGAHALPDDGQGRQAAPVRGRQPDPDLHQPDRARASTASSISRSSAIARSTRTAGSPPRAATIPGHRPASASKMFNERFRQRQMGTVPCRRRLQRSP